MARNCLSKLILSLLVLSLALSLFSCEGSDYFSLDEYERYLLNLKNGILDTPALTVQHFPDTIYFYSSSSDAGNFLYDFEILCVPKENERTIKYYDTYTLIFEADVKNYSSGENVAATIKGLKIDFGEKEIPLAVSDTVNLSDGKLSFAQEIPLNDFASGEKNFSVVLTLQTLFPEQVALFPADSSAAHLKSENIKIQYADFSFPETGQENVTLTFLNDDGSIFQELSAKPLKPFAAPKAEKRAYDFVAWRNLPALCPTENSSYSPIFKLHAYAITYYLQAGEGNSRGNPSTYTIETPTFTLQDATKEGYVFEGWYKDRRFSSNSRVTRIEKTSADRIDDIALYPKFSLPVKGQIKWEKDENLRLELQSGSDASLTAQLELNDGTIPSDILWTSSDEDIVTVESLGRYGGNFYRGRIAAKNVTEQKTVTIKASYSDLQTLCTVTVVPR